jgi:hypothetical protein
MTFKSENWKDKLAEVRNHVALKEGSLEKSADDILNDQIEEELKTAFAEAAVKPETCDSCGQEIVAEEAQEEPEAELEEVKEESNDSPEKTIEKLTERNMLGRLAKQLKLNEEGKQKMFSYFEKGELQQ